MIGFRIKQARENKIYSQEYMAAELGVTQATYSRIESGKITPGLEHIKKIALILEVTINFLID